MSKRNLRAAAAKSGGVSSLVNSQKHEEMTFEQLKEAAFESRRNQDIDMGLKLANDNRRNTLLMKAGFDWFDIEDLQPHPENTYSIDEESIKNLAGLIYTSKETQPLVLRETKDGIQILDGERRWRAHKLLVEMYGEEWRMVPAHCHALDALTDEEALFILHSNNMGQRIMTPSERVRGFKVLADALVEWRKNDPSLKGVKTKTYLAEHFGVSERTAMTNLAIAKGLTDKGMQLLDESKLTQAQAETVSRLPEEQQQAIVDVLKDRELTSKEAAVVIESVKESDGGVALEEVDLDNIPAVAEKKEKETDDYLKKARNSLRKAAGCNQSANFALLGDIKELIRKIEKLQGEE